jgi:hypothetical protein
MVRDDGSAVAAPSTQLEGDCGRGPAAQIGEGSPGVTGRRAPVWLEEDESKKRTRVGWTAAKFQVRLGSQGLIVCSCRRPPSRRPHSTHHSTHHTSTASRACTPTQPGPPVCGRSCQGPREQPGARITGEWEGEDPVTTACVPQQAPSLPVPFSIKVAASSEARPSISLQDRPSFESPIDCLPISRISQIGPDHNLLPRPSLPGSCVQTDRQTDRHTHTQNVPCNHCAIQPTWPGAICSISCAYLTQCRRHLSLARPTDSAIKDRQTIAATEPARLHMCPAHRAPRPHYCSRWFGMSDQSRLVLDSVAHTQKEPGVKRRTHPHNAASHLILVDLVARKLHQFLCTTGYAISIWADS